MLVIRCRSNRSRAASRVKPLNPHWVSLTGPDHPGRRQEVEGLAEQRGGRSAGSPACRSRRPGSATRARRRDRRARRPAAAAGRAAWPCPRRRRRRGPPSAASMPGPDRGALAAVRDRQDAEADDPARSWLRVGLGPGPPCRRCCHRRRRGRRSARAGRPHRAIPRGRGPRAGADSRTTRRAPARSVRPRRRRAGRSSGCRRRTRRKSTGWRRRRGHPPRPGRSCRGPRCGTRCRAASPIRHRRGR